MFQFAIRLKVKSGGEGQRMQQQGNRRWNCNTGVSDLFKGHIQDLGVASVAFSQITRDCRITAPKATIEAPKTTSITCVHQAVQHGTFQQILGPTCTLQCMDVGSTNAVDT
eukprot:106393-Pelagomonas_calceolata.AAC.1